MPPRFFFGEVCEVSRTIFWLYARNRSAGLCFYGNSSIVCSSAPSRRPQTRFRPGVVTSPARLRRCHKFLILSQFIPIHAKITNVDKIEAKNVKNTIFPEKTIKEGYFCQKYQKNSKKYEFATLFLFFSLFLVKNRKKE